MDPVASLRTLLQDRFRIERELGSGATGIVVLAEDLKHGRRVALKVLRPELAQSLGKERFLREIRISARLNHPNILTLIDSGEAEGLLYYVMPYVEGESLRERLRREIQLPLGEALRITGEVADALDHAHGLGIVHRDIKPENILLGAGHAVVTDFGIATAITEAGGEKLTQTGLSVGTPIYMSPEQAAGEPDGDARSDVYSLACVLYEMLAGAPPYTGVTHQAILARKLMDEVPSLRVVRDTVPPTVEEGIRRGLARVPADRPRSAGEFAEALSRDDGPVRHAGTPQPSLRRVLAAAAVLVVLIVAAPLARGGLGFGDPPPTPGPRTTFSQLTGEPGVEWFPSLSPDGEWIVYSGEASGNRDLYLKSVGGQNVIELTKDSPDDDDHPAWSPDGDRIAFRSSRDGGGIFVMGRTGEGVRRITRFGYKPAWSPDGRQLAFVTENVELNPQNSDGMSQLWVADVATGETRRIEGVGDASLPSWSPNGHRIAYMRRVGNPAHADVWTIAPDGGEPVPVTADIEIDWNPVWSPDGRFLYFASGRRGSMNLWRVPVDEASGRPTGDLEPITTPATSLAHISLSADGRRVVYSSVLVSINIQRMDIDPATGTPTGEPTWVTTGTRRWSSPDPSPDGRTIAMYSLAQPDGKLFLVNADGTGLRQVTADSALDRVPRWSPDGEWIAFFSNRSGPLGTWLIRPDGSDLRQLGLGSVPAWSPDGSRVSGGGVPDLTSRNVVFSVDATADRVAKDSLPLPEPALAGFVSNAWSPDGERLAGSFGFGDHGVAVFTFRTGTYERLTDFGQWPVWLPDGRQMLFVSGGDAFYVVDRLTKEVRRVFSVRRDVIGPPRLTLDGRTAYFSRRVTEADVWMVTIE